VLLGLEETCALLLGNHCAELPLSQRAAGSCGNAAGRPAQIPGCYMARVPCAHLFYQGKGFTGLNNSLALRPGHEFISIFKNAT